MKTVVELCEIARTNLAGKGLSPTWYRLSEYTGISHSVLGTYRYGRSVWGKDNALKFKDLLPYPPEIILLWAEMEKENSPEVMAVLERMESQLSAA